MGSNQKETDNFYRSSIIVLDLCAKVLREVLTVFVPPYACPTRLNPKVKVQPQQQQIINNIQANGDYDECDIPLLYILFRNAIPSTAKFKPTKGWGRLNDSGYIDPLAQLCGDDVERIRIQRNRLVAYVDHTRMEDTTYEGLVTEMTSIMHRFDKSHAGALPTTQNAGNYVVWLNNVLSCPLDHYDVTKIKSDVFKLTADFSSTSTKISKLQNSQVQLAAHLTDIDQRVSKLSEEQETCSKEQKRIDEQQRELAIGFNTLQEETSELRKFLRTCPGGVDRSIYAAFF